jgi:gluconokinase
MNYILGLDIGTTHAKVIAMSSAGENLHACKESYQPVEGLIPGHHEFNADIIRDAAIKLLLDTIKALPGQIPSAICISSAMHSLMLVNDKGNAITNLITWADLRSAPQAKRMKEGGDAISLYKKTGTPVHPMSPFCKLLWLKENQYKVFKSAHKFIGIKEYIVHYLCGSYFVDHGIASATGLFNIKDKCWDVSILKMLEVSAAQLAVTVPVSYQSNVTNKKFLELAQLSQPFPLIAGSSDGALANVGSGAIGDKRLSITVGTSGAVRKIVNKRLLDDHAANFCYVFDDKQFITGGPINNGGNLLKWFCKSMLNNSLDTSEETNRFFNLEDPSGNLLFLPYIQGERAPVWDAEAKGIFFGIDSSHTLTDFQHAVGESICYSLRQLVELSDKLHGHSDAIILSGGLSNSEPFTKLLATVLKRNITVSDDADASAIGACLLGWKTLGVINRYEELLQDISGSKVIVPDTNLTSAHDSRFHVFEKLYAKNVEMMHEL